VQARRRGTPAIRSRVSKYSTRHWPTGRLKCRTPWCEESRTWDGPNSSPPWRAST
jgi:hypothetical protein